MYVVVCDIQLAREVVLWEGTCMSSGNEYADTYICVYIYLHICAFIQCIDTYLVWNILKIFILYKTWICLCIYLIAYINEVFDYTFVIDKIMNNL